MYLLKIMYDMHLVTSFFHVLTDLEIVKFFVSSSITEVIWTNATF